MEGEHILTFDMPTGPIVIRCPISPNIKYMFNVDLCQGLLREKKIVVMMIIIELVMLMVMVMAVLMWWLWWR